MNQDNFTLGYTNFKKLDNPYDDNTSENLDLSGTPVGKAAMAAGKSISGGGSVMDTIGSGALASGNPYAMGGGLALLTLSAISKANEAEAQRKYKAELDKYDAKSNAINRLANYARTIRPM